jgi:hypothetical protein
MAKYKQGFLGSFSGKLGNAIGTFWKGIQVLRVVPANVTNPRTPAQVAQRAKFTLLTKFLAKNMKVFKIGFGALDLGMTEFNAAFKANYMNAVKGSYPEQAIDVKNIIVSKGVLPSLNGFTAVSTTPNTIDLSWTDNSSYEGATGTDKINVIAFDELSGESYYLLQVADRITESYTFNLPAAWSGKKVSIYAFLNSESGIGRISNSSQVSDSVSASNLTIA